MEIKNRIRYYELRLIALDRNRPHERSPKVQAAHLRKRERVVRKLIQLKKQ